MRVKTWIPLLVLLVLVGVALSDVEGQPGPPPGAETQRIIRGFNIAPVPLKLRGRNRALVGLGSYIVNAPGGDPFAGEPEEINADGYLAGGTAFGPFVSRNLTPDEHGLPAGYTFQQFREVIRTGHDLKNAHPQFRPLLQVMPWPVYSHMIDRDLRAVYEFLRSIPSIETGS